jgi:hypothetical protein
LAAPDQDDFKQKAQVWAQSAAQIVVSECRARRAQKGQKEQQEACAKARETVTEGAV